MNIIYYVNNIHHFDIINIMPNSSELPKDINLLPDNAIQKASAGQQIFRLMLKRGKTLIIITEAIVLIVFLSRFKIDRQINDATENLDNKAAIIRSSQNLEKEHNRIQYKTTQLQNIYNSQKDWAKIISDFDSKIPSDIVLENISYSKNSISFRAKVDTASSFGFFVGILKDDPNVNSVTLQSSRFIPDEQSYDFSMSVDLTDN